MPPRRYQPRRRGPRPQRKRTGPPSGTATADAPAQAPARPTGPVELPSSIAVKDLAEALGVSHADIIKELIRNGIFATINQTIDFDTASLVAGELGFETTERGAAERAAAAEAEQAQLVAPGATADASGKPVLFTEEDEARLQPVRRNQPGVDVWCGALPCVREQKPSRFGRRRPKRTQRKHRGVLVRSPHAHSRDCGHVAREWPPRGDTSQRRLWYARGG
jgi:hypothetical protein